MPLNANTGLHAHEQGSFGASYEWAIEYLKQRGVHVGDQTPLRTGVARMRAAAAEPDRIVAFENVARALHAVGPLFGSDFVTKALHRASLKQFNPPLEKLEALAVSDFNVLVPGESRRVRNLVWELLIGSLAARFATNVSFPEPDIACTFDGRRVHIAAKMAYSAKNLWKLVKEGYDQCSKYDADIDVVYVNVVQLLQRKQEEWAVESKQQNFTHNDPCVEWAQCQTRAWTMQHAHEVHKMGERLRSRAKREFAIVFFTPVLLWFDRGLAPLLNNDMVFYSDGSVDFVTALQGACNSTLGSVL